ncbi:glycosyltransferase [Vibrio sp. 10N.247.311.14]|uniref:glycosyltransferase n=1 Tax=unclassified Vibrio TaxID=2614977 RepID=UPI0022CD635F|nr:glycosyltransferase [Vibrio sp. RW]MDA0146575.1 glycosyltransferase [Vibrio sp. RW]
MGKRVAVFTSDLYQGGVAESTRKIVDHLSDTCTVDVIVYDTTPILKKVKCANIVRLNLPLSANFSTSKFNLLCKKIFRYPALLIAVFKLYRYKVKYKPDVIYSMTYIPNIVNVLVSLMLGESCKTILSERQDPRKDLVEGTFLTYILKFLYKRSDVIHANSNEMIRSIETFYRVPRSKIFHLDNFFVLDDIKKLSREGIEHDYEYIFNNFKVIVTAGRLSKQKGQWHLIDAFDALCKSNDAYRLVILGEGELRNFLEDRVKKYKLEDKVFFLGNVDNPHKYIARSHLFIFTSLWESFGNCLVEAMALDIPIISTECESGPGYIIDGGNYGLSLGKLSDDLSEISRSDVIKIVDSVKFFENEDNHKRFSLKSYDRAKFFDVDELKDKIDKLFQI